MRARGGGVEMICSAEIAEISHADGRFRIASDRETFEAPALVIATGGSLDPENGRDWFCL